MSEEKKGALGGLKEKLFGKDERSYMEQPQEFARLGVKWTLDWHLAARMDRLRELREKIEQAKDIDERLHYDNQFLDEIAAFYGEPGDNLEFFRPYKAWKQLYGYYQVGRDVALLTQGELKSRSIRLHMLADVCRSKSMLSKHITPNTPIVLYLPQPQGAPGGPQPFYRSKYGEKES